jgi:hypothetical protein
VAYRNDNTEFTERSFVFIVFLKPPAKAVHLHPGSRVIGWIESRRPSQHFNTDVVFLDLLGFSGKVFGAEIPEKRGQTG